jgi:hypothetical protein
MGFFEVNRDRGSGCHQADDEQVAAGVTCWWWTQTA